MKEIKINEVIYTIEKDYKNALDTNELNDKVTDYFSSYDFIVGDWAYGKLRLKGFYNENNKKASKINNIKYLDDYIKDYCAYECKYFVLKVKETLKNN